MNRTTRRTLLALPAALAAPGIAHASYPDRPIRMLIPYGGGGQTDVVSRILAEAMGTALGQPVTPDNRPGAAGVIAAEALLQSPADGYSLLISTRNTQAINVALRPSISYRHEDVLTTVGVHASTANILLVNQAIPAETVADFVAYAKARPGQLSFASSGIGATTHLSMELLMERTGIDLVHVPYRQSTQGMTDLLAGRVQARVLGLPEAEPVKDDARVRALGVTSRNRSENWPNVPAIAEYVPDYEAINTFGVMVRSGTPPAMVARLNQAMNTALRSTALREAFARVGAEPLPENSPEQAEAFARRQAELWVPLIRRLNLSAQ